MARQIDGTLMSMGKILKRDELHVSCALNPGRQTGEPFAYLTIGPFSLHPDTTLLREIRDKISRFLESQDGKRLADIEAGIAVVACPNPACGKLINVSGPRFECEACGWHGDTADIEDYRKAAVAEKAQAV